VAPESVFATWPKLRSVTKPTVPSRSIWQVALGELESILVEDADVVHVVERLIEVMLVARVDQRVNADTQVVGQVFLDVADILFDQPDMLANRDWLRVCGRGRRDGDRLLDLLDLAGGVGLLLLQIAHLAGQRIESLLFAGADDRGCGGGDDSFPMFRCGFSPTVRVGTRAKSLRRWRRAESGQRPGSFSFCSLSPPSRSARFEAAAYYAHT